MRQVIQSLRDGSTEIADVPCPAVGSRQVLVQTAATLVSAGTERMLVEFGKAGWLAKARQQPEKVRLVVDKMRTDGIAPTLEAVFNKLDQPLPLGYCNVGRVLEVGSAVRDLEAGDRVVSNGRHAEVVAVSANLTAKVPENVRDDQAAFTVLAAIALQGVRLVQPSLGETVAVIGLGLVGLLTVQFLRATGCDVVGLDFSPERLDLAASFGARTIRLTPGHDPVAAAMALSRGRGVDAAIIAASTAANDPVRQAAQMCRKRGRIVLVGVSGLELSRADFYEKELTFQVSCSYGPGRYDPAYETKGIDYPLGFVRWTAQRNFEAVLDMLASGRIDVEPLISHRFTIENAAAAYDLIVSGEPSLGILLDYPGPDRPDEPSLTRRTVAIPGARHALPPTGRPRVAFIGAGNYANAVLMPAFKAAQADLRVVCTQTGVTALHAARRHGFREATTDVHAATAAPEADVVVIATRHESHAALTCQALASGKHVFVEKPLALTHAEIDDVITAADSAAGLVTVGFNRRFAPHVVRMKSLLGVRTGPKSLILTVNAGAIPADHWSQDAQTGGGRIAGEACHFIDLARHLVGVPITGHRIAFLEAPPGDTATITLWFADGSIAAIHYFANGSRSFPKERVEVFAGGGILQLDNFRTLTGHGWPGFSRLRLWRQDKGQRQCVQAFLDAVTVGGPPPIPVDELVEVARVTVDLAAAKGSAP